MKNENIMDNIFLEDAFDQWWTYNIDNYDIRTDTFESFKAGANFGYNLIKAAFDDRVRVIEMQLEDKKQLLDQINQLKHEIEVLRLYGNKDCTAMADEALGR